MTTLIACLSTGKGTWSTVARLIDSADWEKVILITPFAKDRFKADGKKVEVIQFNENVSMDELIKFLVDELAKRIVGIEVAVNLTSGSGYEHMALLSALIKLGVGIRFVIPDEGGVKEV